MSEVLKFTVSKEYEGKKAVVYLRTHCRFSARTLALLKKTEGSILRNSDLLRTIDIIHEGDEITVSFPKEESNNSPVYGELDVLYEDNYLLILNKPPNTPVHPVKKHQLDTLANFVSYRYQNTDNDFVFRAVNRLDSDTSGIVIIARDRHTASLLQKSNISKSYLAVCHGVVNSSGVVDLPIGLSDNSKIVREVRADGKSAVTRYEPLEVFDDRTLLKLSLETGRTHQIRCHLSYLGYPLMGDDLYGGERKEISRQALHCAEVSFIHPYTNEIIKLHAEIPDDMKQLI